MVAGLTITTMCKRVHDTKWMSLFFSFSLFFLLSFWGVTEPCWLVQQFWPAHGRELDTLKYSQDKTLSLFCNHKVNVRYLLKKGLRLIFYNLMDYSEVITTNVRGFHMTSKTNCPKMYHQINCESVVFCSYCNCTVFWCPLCSPMCLIAVAINLIVHNIQDILNWGLTTRQNGFLYGYSTPRKRLAS